MKSYCLIGSPIRHSLSPAMMNLSFEHHRLDAHYGLREADTEAAAAVVEALKEEGVSGWNVTMPCKHVMSLLCDELSTASAISGSVNTVVNRDGRLIGHTTDGVGFMNAAEAAGFPLKGKKMTLLGTGGAAGSILIQAALDGVTEIAVFWNREESKQHLETIASKLREYSDTRIIPCSYRTDGALRSQIAESTALVNATNVGMKQTGTAADCLIPELSYLREELFVYDIIYHPAKTALLAMADAAGCRYENGLSMLIGQGAESFRLWTGLPMPVDKVKTRLTELMSSR